MRFTLALVLALGFLVGNPAGALATGTYPAGSAGYDVSWPQCGGPLPHLNRGDFGIVGVTGGREIGQLT